MKKFFTYVLSLLIILMAIAFFLDFFYTSIYLKSNSRNKIQYVLNSTPRHYNIIILGSSRAENHVIPNLFKRKGLTCYNLGMSGGGLSECALLLKLFLDKGNTVDKIILQSDLIYEYEESSYGNKATFLPYINQEKTIYNHLKDNDSDKDKNLFYFKFIPFYRYIFYDSKIGIRETFFTLIHKENSFIGTDGFSKLEGKLKSKDLYKLPKRNKTTNKYFYEIQNLCKKNQIELIPFAAPFCKYRINNDYFKNLKKNIPQLLDYSNSITADSLFYSCGHLNIEGAEVFTEILIRDIYN